jgi:hypothetical protein
VHPNSIPLHSIPNIEISDLFIVSGLYNTQSKSKDHLIPEPHHRKWVCYQTVFTMSPEKYHLRPQTNGFTPGYQYVEVPGSSNFLSQATYQMFFDGLPRTPDHYFGVTSPSASHQLPSDYNITSPIQMSQAPVSRTYPLSNVFDGQNTNSYHGFMGNALNGPYSQDEFNVPRYAAQYDMTQLSDRDLMMDGYEPSSYMLDSNKPNNQHTSAGRSNSIYDPIENSCDFPRPSISRSPKLEYDDMANDPMSSDRAPSFTLPSRETSEGGQSSREMTATNVEGQATDEPYAKLIYRALMSAPNYSMVLQEIYQWFRDNTSKGSSDTKGWMNSIRHNLSMNAVRPSSYLRRIKLTNTGFQENGAEDFW